jgi:hypothetical protein
MTFYRSDVWIDKGGSTCVQNGLEGPSISASAYSLRPEDFALVPLPDEVEIFGPLVCREDGVSSISYVNIPEFEMVLVQTQSNEIGVGGPVENLSVLTTDVGEVVLAPVTEPTAARGSTLIRPTSFGFVVVSGGALSLEEATDLITAVDEQAIVFPEGKPLITELNGITFYSTIGEPLSRCRYSQYGIRGEFIDAPEDPRVQILPGYLPADVDPKYSGTMYQRCDDIEAGEAHFSVPTNSYLVTRKSGAPEWYTHGSEDWYTPMTVAGLNAVMMRLPEWMRGDDVSGTLLIREEFGITVVSGPDAAEVIKIAEGLNR